MTDYTIPRANAPIAGTEAPSPPWYNFLRYLDTRTASAAGDVQAEITVIAEKLGSPDGTVDNIPPLGNVTSVQGKQSIASSGIGVVQLRLVNDADTVDAVSFYGTDSAGVKGWNLLYDAFDDTANIEKINTSGIVSFDLTDLADSGTGALLATTFDAKGRKTGTKAATITGTAGRVTVANGDAVAGLPTIDLATLSDGGGGTLLRIVRDAWGRLSGTSAATTSDLTEGSNLYFTTARVLATLLAGLSTATGAAITAADSVLSAFGKLQAQITALTSSLTGYVPTTRTITAGVGLSGGGDLSANRTVSMGAPSTLTGATTNSATGTTHTHALTVTKSDVGLGNADNTSDANKPVSTAQAAADALRVLKAGDNMTGSLTTSGVFGSGGSAFLGDALFTGGQAGTWAQSSTAAARLACLSSASNVQFIGARCGGTLASPTATPSVVALLEFDASSYTGSGWVYPGTAAWVTTEAHSATARGTRFQIATTPTGSATLLARLNIDRVGTGAVGPGADNTQDLGEASLRWAVVRAGTGAINTSDAREKTNVTPLTAAELAAAADLARAPGTYQWLASVQAKGADARKHAGLTVQRAIEIMQAHGLDPFAYGFICYDAWDEQPEVVASWPAQDAVMDDDGNVITPAVEAGSEITQEYRPAGDRYSFRHDELLLFIARGAAEERDAQAKLIIDLTARLDALEAA